MFLSSIYDFNEDVHSLSIPRIITSSVLLQIPSCLIKVEICFCVIFLYFLNKSSYIFCFSLISQIFFPSMIICKLLISFKTVYSEYKRELLGKTDSPTKYVQKLVLLVINASAVFSLSI